MRWNSLKFQLLRFGPNERLKNDTTYFTPNLQDVIGRSENDELIKFKVGFPTIVKLKISNMSIEKDSFLDHLAVMFAPGNYPEWDTTNDYQLGNLKVYFEDRHNGSLVHVQPETVFS